MLEFIVLGQIPGTSVQITHMQVIIAVFSLMIAKNAGMLIRRHSAVVNKRRLIDTISI